MNQTTSDQRSQTPAEDGAATWRKQITQITQYTYYLLMVQNPQQNLGHHQNLAISSPGHVQPLHNIFTKICSQKSTGTKNVTSRATLLRWSE